MTNSVDSTPVFLELEPDWSQSVVAVQKWKTDISISFNGTEQRATRRDKAKWDLSFTGPNFDERDWPLRRAQQMAEYERPTVVPFWTRQDLMVALVGDELEIDGDVTGSPYKVGGYVYFAHPDMVPAFRLITAITTSEAGDTTMTLEAGAVPDYPAGTPVYPCLLCVRKENKGAWEHSQLDATPERIEVEEL